MRAKTWPLSAVGAVVEEFGPTEEPTRVHRRSIPRTPAVAPHIPSCVQESEIVSERTQEYGLCSLQEVAAALPPYVEAHFDVVDGPDSGLSFPLTMAQTLIGRGTEADVRLRDAKAS